MKQFRLSVLRVMVPVAAAALAMGTASAITTTQGGKTASTTRKHYKKKVAVKTAVKSAHPLSAVAPTVALKTRTSAGRKRVYVQTWDEPTYKDSTSGDAVDGEDLTVRQAAVEALGPMNGSIVAVDPTTGRVLTIVNQKLALSGGFQPCSTVKVSVALAALRENLIQRTSPVRFYSKRSLDLTDALAYSNNYYFANLGIKLGYERFNYYAHLFGYGEKAGLDIEGEQPGSFPSAPPKNGGMGMLTSFGEEISQTPLELAGLMSAVANGGTLYWLQYPRSPDEINSFQPQVKRHLDIESLIDEIKPGMRGAVEFGTARRAKQDDVILGKTGTCSEGRTRLGWFGSFIESSGKKVVVVVMLTGGRPSIGSMASSIAGDVYRRLASENYFKPTAPLMPASILTPQLCCAR
jgi:penicillin-binding protein 2